MDSKEVAADDVRRAAERERLYAARQEAVAKGLPEISKTPRLWSRIGWTTVLVAVGVAAIYLSVALATRVAPRPATVVSILLVIPLSIGLGALSMRQYHRYRSALQALIDGRKEKQQKIAEEEKARKEREAAGTQSAASATAQLTKRIDGVGTKIEGIVEKLAEVDRRAGESQAVLKDRLDKIAERLAEARRHQNAGRHPTEQAPELEFPLERPDRGEPQEG